MAVLTRLVAMSSGAGGPHHPSPVRGSCERAALCRTPPASGEDAGVSVETASSDRPRCVRRSGCPPTGARRPRPGPLVRSVLAEADLDALLNEALLLTTELSTNAVVHAGTELDIEVIADPAGLTVTVTDFAAGPVDNWWSARRSTTLPTSRQISERGRGLLLVDHFACRWGTVHDGDRQGRLVPPRPARRAAGAVPRPAVHAGGRDRGGLRPARCPSAGAMAALIQIDARPARRRRACPTSPTDLLSRLSPRWSARPAAWSGSTAATAPAGRCWPGTAGRPAPDDDAAPGAAAGQPAVRRGAGARRRAHRVRPAAGRRSSPSGSRCTWRTTGCAGPTCAGRPG